MKTISAKVLVAAGIALAALAGGGGSAEARGFGHGGFGRGFGHGGFGHRGFGHRSFYHHGFRHRFGASVGTTEAAAWSSAPGSTVTNASASERTGALGSSHETGRR
jgi:hypothetical protein